MKVLGTGAACDEQRPVLSGSTPEMHSMTKHTLGSTMKLAFIVLCALVWGCSTAAPGGGSSGCNDDRDCNPAGRCLRDGTCLAVGTDAGTDTSTMPLPAEQDPGGGGLTIPSGLPPVGSGDPSWRPSSPVRLDCPWTTQLLSACASMWNHCAPTSYVMATACMERRSLANQDSPELIAVIRQLSDGSFPSYSGRYPCGQTTDFGTIADLAIRNGRAAMAGFGATLQTLDGELRAGRPVIVGIPTQKHHTTDMMSNSPSSVAHAMLVTGLDMTHVYLNDPGRGASVGTALRVGRRFTIESFLAVWGGPDFRGYHMRFATAASTCTGECTRVGEVTCRGASQSQTCGQFNDDPCLEWGPVTPCPPGQTCGVSGCSGVACTEGAACNNGNPCETARIQCSSGRPVCMRQTFAATGTPCPSGTCNGTGTCTCPTRCPSPSSVACGTSLGSACGSACTGTGTMCPSGQICSGSTCRCPTSCPAPSSVPCGSPLGSVCGMACGGTGTMCSSGRVCSGGTCMCPSSCPSPSAIACGTPLGSACGLTCTGTGTMCPSGQVCSGSTCRCATSCPAPSSIPCGSALGSVCGMACSGTGTMCASGSVCRSGTCSPAACPAPQIASPISSDTNRYFARQGDIILLRMYRSVGCETMPHQGHIAQVDCGNVYGTGAAPLSADIAGTTWSVDTRSMPSGTCWRFTFSVYDPTQRAAPFGVIQMADPRISYSPPSGSVGTTFTESGTGFTPNGAVDLRWRYPDGHYEPPSGPQRVTATSSGSWSLVWTSPPTALRGTYSATASDVTTRLTATTTFTIR